MAHGDKKLARRLKRLIRRHNDDIDRIIGALVDEDDNPIDWDDVDNDLLLMKEGVEMMQSLVGDLLRERGNHATR